jgi:hypothetical protein
VKRVSRKELYATKFVLRRSPKQVDIDVPLAPSNYNRILHVHVHVRVLYIHYYHNVWSVHRVCSFCSNDFIGS